MGDGHDGGQRDSGRWEGNWAAACAFMKCRGAALLARFCGRGSVSCSGAKEIQTEPRARKRSAEEEPADHSVSVWIGVGHPDGDMAAQVPNEVLTASKPGNHASVQ
jgi:hypothetical protein